MAWNQMPGILDSEVALQLAFEKIPGLTDHAKQYCESGWPPGNRPIAEDRRGGNPGCGRREQAADRAGPRLAGRNRRRQARPADRPPDHIGTNVTRPDNQQQHDHIGATTNRRLSQPDQCHRSNAQIRQPERHRPGRRHPTRSDESHLRRGPQQQQRSDRAGPRGHQHGNRQGGEQGDRRQRPLVAKAKATHRRDRRRSG